MLQRTEQQSIDLLPLDVHELPLAQELTADFGQAVPCDQGVVLRPLPGVGTAVLIRRERESRWCSHRRSFPGHRTLCDASTYRAKAHYFAASAAVAVRCILEYRRFCQSSPCF
jgi:hypothetical protein